MQRYVLRCDSGHRAVSWFRSKADADRLIGAGLALCPDCDEQHKRGFDTRGPAIRQAAAEDGPPVRRPLAN
jgi:hypothetical protein